MDLDIIKKAVYVLFTAYMIYEICIIRYQKHEVCISFLENTYQNPTRVVII